MREEEEEGGISPSYLVSRPACYFRFPAALSVPKFCWLSHSLNIYFTVLSPPPIRDQKVGAKEEKSFSLCPIGSTAGKLVTLLFSS